MEIKLQALKSIITDKNFIQAISDAVLEGPAPEKTGDENEGGEEGGLEVPPETGGIMDDIQSSFDEGLDLPEPNETEETPEVGETETTNTEEAGELPPVSEIVPESQIEES